MHEHDHVPQELQQLAPADLEYLQEWLKHLIGEANKRIQYAEARRNAFLVMAGALAAGSFALFTLALNLRWNPVRVALLALGCAWVLTAIIEWTIYALQTNFRYPFLKSRLFRQWKWFYKGLPNADTFKAPIHTRISGEEAERQLKEFEDQWTTFESHQVAGLTDRKLSAFQDLQQLYLLLVNERYKNLFLTSLRTVLSTGALLSILAFVLAFAVALPLQRGHDTDRSQRQQGLVTVNANWTPTSVTRTVGQDLVERQLDLKLSIESRSPDRINVVDVIAFDSDGDSIPLVLASPLGKQQVAPGETRVVRLVVWVAATFESEIRSFGVTLGR
jgi:hypothetical protein